MQRQFAEEIDSYRARNRVCDQRELAIIEWAIIERAIIELAIFELGIMKKVSIGVRLTIWYLALFAAAQLLFGVGMWIALRQHLYGIANDALGAQAEDLTHFLRSQKERNWPVPKLREETAETYDLEHSGNFLQIRDQDGNWIFRAPLLEQNQFASPAPATVKGRFFQDVQLGGKPFRFITQRIEANGRSYTVQTGLPIGQIAATLNLFGRSLLMLAPLLLLAAGSGGYWLSRKALRPVDAITRTARSIGGTNLSDRLEKLTTGDELQRLSDTLNQMLGRIESAFLRVTQFTADASHELRTPVSVMRTSAELALRKPRTDAEYRDSLAQILAESEKVSQLIEQLLVLARADAASPSIPMHRIDLAEPLRNACLHSKVAADAKGLAFREFIQARPLWVQGDAASLERLFLILLDNAVKYTPTGGQIEVRLTSEDQFAVAEVRDTGIGIAPEDIPRVFDRFYRADPARTRESGGIGLGLAIGRWIAQAHQGEIQIESGGSQGSVFRVRMPPSAE